MYSGTHLDTVEVTRVMKACAVAHGLDPTRTVPAGLRCDVLTQMDLNAPQLLRQLQGGWRSQAGEQHYWFRLLQVAAANQAAVHDPGASLPGVMRVMASTPAVGSDSMFS